MNNETDFLKRLKTQHKLLLDGSLDSMVLIAETVTKLANKFADDITSAYNSQPSKTIASIRSEYLALLTVLANTKTLLDSKVVELDKNFEKLKSSQSSLPPNWPANSAHSIAKSGRKAKIFAEFSSSLKENSKNLEQIIREFEKSTGINPNTFNTLGLPALDLVLFYGELYFHAHAGPWVTLWHLFHLRHEVKKRSANPLKSTLCHLVEIDTLIESMRVISISLRQMPTNFQHGSPIPVSQADAQVELDKDVTATKLRLNI